MYKKILLLFILLTLLFCFVYPVQAQGIVERMVERLGRRGARVFVLAPPEMIMVNVIMWVMSIIGIVAVGFIIYGAILYITSGGSEEQIARAKKILFWAIAGLAIAILAVVIATTIVRILQAEWCLVVAITEMEGWDKDDWAVAVKGLILHRQIGLCDVHTRQRCIALQRATDGADINPFQGKWKVSTRCVAGRCESIAGVLPVSTVCLPLPPGAEDACKRAFYNVERLLCGE